MKFLKPMLLTLLMTATAQQAHTLDIPLSGENQGSGGGSGNIGYVDMDRIFEVYPQTQAAKEDYAKQLKKKRELLTAKESEMNEVQNRLSVLESTMKQGAAATTPDGQPDPTAASGNQGMEKMKADLEAKKAELDDLRKQASADLATFQSQQSQIILGKIYQALRDVAVEEQVNVVVDKSSILYGDAAIDLTEKLQQRVRGY